MIRINLVSGERKAAKAAGRTFELGQKVTAAGSSILLITALLVGWRYWALGQREAQMGRDIEASHREEQRLAEVLGELRGELAEGRVVFGEQGQQLVGWAHQARAVLPTFGDRHRAVG